MFSSLRRIHLVRGFLCRKQTCTVTDCDTPLDGPPSVDTTSYSRHQPTIVLIAAGRRSVHSMRLSHILGQNPNFCLPTCIRRPHWFPSEYCCDVWYGKIRMVWLPEGEKNLKVCLFVLTECMHTNMTDTQADRRVDTA